MIELKARDLKVGDEFTTQEDQGAVWFRVAELTKPANGIIDVLGLIVQANPDLDYEVGKESWWMDLGTDEEVIVR